VEFGEFFGTNICTDRIIIIILGVTALLTALGTLMKAIAG
jgi:hypothetical protein